ncbi:MAG: hypothetical protein P8M32_08000, partial [Phycisphaerales bacterium]|nr:hypothetical protein [Phycisphaerales bacterium]
MIGLSILSVVLMVAAEGPTPAPLVPNGALLTRVEGIMVKPEPGDPWTLRLVGEAADPEGRTRDFILLPS